jgi:type VI protein secretion system component VasK
MAATIRPAVLVLAALLLIASCGGSASTGHTARSACQQQADRIQRLATDSYYDAADGNQLKALATFHDANALWGRMHKEHCPASSYTQLNRTLSGLGLSLHG